MSDDDWFRIGELSERARVPRHTIRFYERTGVLPTPERTPSGYRSYTRDAVARLEFVKRGKALGLRLADIRKVLEMSESGRQPCDLVQDLVAARLRDVKARLHELEELESTLRDALARLDAGRADGACRCAVIEETPVKAGSSGRAVGATH